jgi:hypothetical protein
MALVFPEHPTLSGNAERFGGRWRLVGAGLSNVWRYGDLELGAPSGRLLLRGPNGTGKTTALEALWPYLLDLDRAHLAAGKGRPTNLSALMREGAAGRRRVGYLWLSFAGPGDQDVVTYGVRLNFSEGGSPPVRINPFFLSGRPLHDLALWGVGRSTLTVEQFTDAVEQADGLVFPDEDAYVRDLAARVLQSEPREVTALAARIRSVRNPALLADLSPRDAARALQQSLPGVDHETVEATGEALAESDATRRAFERDRDAADRLATFAATWTGHAVDVTRNLYDAAAGAAAEEQRLRGERDRLGAAHSKAITEAERLDAAHERLLGEHRDLAAVLHGIEQSDDYRDAGRLTDLKATVEAKRSTAEAQWGALERAARAARERTASAVRRVEELEEDITDIFRPLTEADPGGAVPTTFLTWEQRAQAALRVGERSVGVGRGLHVAVDLDALDTTVTVIRQRVSRHQADADRIKLHVSAHKQVADTEAAAKAVRSHAEQLADTAEREGRRRLEAEAAATDAAAGFEQEVRSWLHARAARPEWSSDDLDEIPWTDTSAAIAAAERFAEDTARWALAIDASAQQEAKVLTGRAHGLRVDAAELRDEAAALREGRVLPLPRPTWAGDGNDAAAFGSAIDWVAGVDQDVQDSVEAALAAAGVLGAALDAAGATSALWSVRSLGPELKRNLLEVLTADDAHPLATTARSVLARIALAPTATDGADTALVIGLDGTFRAGVAVAAQGTEVAAATHIGALRRRNAALARAGELEAGGERLDAEAVGLDAEAEAAREVGRAAKVSLAAFPARERLRDAESRRVAAALAAQEADAEAADADTEAARLHDQALAARRDWIDAVVAAGFPPSLEELQERRDSAERAAKVLTAGADTLAGRLRRRLASFEYQPVTDDLAGLHAAAQQAHDEAAADASRYEELSDQVGRSAAEVLRRHEQVSSRLREAGPKAAEAAGEAKAAGLKAADLGGKLEAAEENLRGAGPASAKALIELRTLLSVPGVAAAVLADEVTPVDAALLEQVRSATERRETSAKATLRKLRDETQAAVAGVWSIDPGVEHPLLETYVLTHGADAYAPPAASAHAQTLADRAEAALRRKDEEALRSFVVGRLPTAIAQAWTRLNDWRDEVNAKMKAASASSGVGVRVAITPRDDLPPTTQTVLELTCKTGAALRDPDAREIVGEALQQLIAAAEGDDMTARVGAAVDIRDWVDVIYQVTRPGEAPKNWGPRTGLSGGERRLVVLAPMLAAVAAAYDRFPPGAARIAALDEIPSEVDDAGREGLARYIAELDLDLIATSHHWDGAPGAWDGVDAHDLEAGPDGTVVAFPMLVRGLALLPGDIK